MRLKHKICIATGAAQRIGLATALKFARDDATVVACDMRRAGVDAAALACRDEGALAEGHVVDVTDRAVIDAMVAGIQGNFDQTNCAAAKFGVIRFTKTWRRELGATGVRVNAVAPGFVETPTLASGPDKVLRHMRRQVPLQRLGRPEESPTTAPSWPAMKTSASAARSSRCRAA